MQVTSYIALATLALNAATSRFVLQAMTAGDPERAIGLFNTAVFATLGLVALLAIPAAFVAYNIEKFIAIPVVLVDDARWLFAATFTAFLISALRSPFEVAMFCKNRLDIQNLISALDTLIKVLVTVSLFWVVNKSLGNVGLGILAASLSTALLSIAAWRLLMPALRLDISKFDKRMLQPLTTVGGWTVINQVGSILFLSIDLVIANRYLGIEAGGVYAALLMWPMMIRTMAGYIGVNFTPAFVKLHTQGDIEELSRHGILSVRVMALFTVGPIFVLSGLSSPLLSKWLGGDWIQHQYLLDLMLMNLIVNVPVVPLFGLVQATTNMKSIGLITLAMGLMNVATSVLLCTETSLGLWGIAIASIFWFNVKNALLLPLYVKRILGNAEFTVSRLYSALIPAALAGFVTWCAIRAYLHSFDITHGWVEMGAVAVVAEILFFLFYFFMPGTMQERRYFWLIVESVRNRIGGKQ
jgi:membrane protein EpsK